MMPLKCNTLTISILAAIAIWSSPVMAQKGGYCAKRSVILRHLQTKEQDRIGIGLLVTGNVAETFVAKDGQFTFVVTTSNGFSCRIGHGRAWTSSPTTPSGPKS